MHKVIQSKLKQAQTKLLYALPIMAIVITLALATGIYLETTVGFTHAEANTASGNGGATVTAAADRDLTVTIHNSEIVLDLTPSQQGVFSSNDFENSPLTVEVATNNPTGYNLNMTTTTTNLTRTAPLSGQTPVIQTLSSSGSFTADNFETNAWGFSLDGINYQAIKASRQINQTIKESNSSVTNISFGVKLNDEIPSGNYKATLTFIATTNPLEANFDTAFDAAGKTQVSYNGQNYYKMQDMSGFICSMVATPTDTTSAESTQLIDTRDNSVYWVSKLLDGNCWMTQNLDLDLSSSVALTNANTDLNSVTSWTPVRSTIDSTSYGNITTCSSQSDSGTGCWGQTNTGFASGWTNDDNTPYSDNPGYRYMTFTDRTTKNDYWYSNGDTFANCSAQDTNCGGQGHYMIGNYYNFAAATATNDVQTTAGGSANVVQNKVMPDSICPKGWRMPIDQTTNNEFNTLLAAYNITGTGAFEFNFQGLNKVRRDPLYFVRSGFVNGDTLYSAGADSVVWSSTISSSTNGYRLHFNGVGIYPALSDSHRYGFAVRCLARTDLTIEDATYLQDVTPEMRQNTAIGTTATLKDKRDNQEYTIAKLKDGNIWMTTNLNLAGGTPLYSDTSDVPAVNTIASGNPYYTLPASQTITSGTTLNGGFNDDNNSLGYVFNSGNDTDNCKNGCYSYYSYNAATASSGSDITSGDAAYSICPSGWKLPTSRDEITAAKTSSDFYKMAINYGLNPTVVNEDPDSDPRFCDLGGDCSTSNVPHFLRAGNYYGPVFYAGGEHSYYWSSTASNDTDACYMVYTQGHIYSSRSNHRLYGFPIRCLLK